MINAHPNTLYVVSAGNSADDAALYMPCNSTAPNLVCVGSSDNRDLRSDFSNVSATAVDLFAPGLLRALDDLNGGYAYANGTSMAAPHVSGVAALLAADEPGATVAQLKAALLSSVDVKAAFSGLALTGGRLNAASALTALEVAVAPTPTPTPTPRRRRPRRRRRPDRHADADRDADPTATPVTTPTPRPRRSDAAAGRDAHARPPPARAAPAPARRHRPQDHRHGHGPPPGEGHLHAQRRRPVTIAIRCAGSQGVREHRTRTCVQTGKGRNPVLRAHPQAERQDPARGQVHADAQHERLLAQRHVHREVADAAAILAAVV